MIKLFLAGLPADQVEVLSVVLGVAWDAVFSARVVRKNSDVVAAPLGDPLADFRVAVQAFQFCLAQADSMTLDALGSSTKRPVRPGKWPGGNLCVDGCRDKCQGAKQKCANSRR